MKKVIIFLMLIIVSTNAYSLAGIGIHGGMDMLTVDGESIDVFNVKIGGKNYKYSLQREEISNPIAFGAQVYLDLPIFPIGFECGFGMGYQKYSWSSPDSLDGGAGVGSIPVNLPGYKSVNGMYKEEFSFIRMSVDATAKWYFLDLPPGINIASFYIGGGVGLHMITPIVSKNMLEDNLSNASEIQKVKFDIEEEAEKLTVFGGHAVFGVKIKPPVLPIMIDVCYKYRMIPENDYGDKTNSFGTIRGALCFYI